MAAGERKLLTLVYNLGLTAGHYKMGYEGVMKRLWILAATISSTFVTTLAIPAPSVEAGATKATTCQACHGANGNSTNTDWPSLAGIGADYIARSEERRVG